MNTKIKSTGIFIFILLIISSLSIFVLSKYNTKETTAGNLILEEQEATIRSIKSANQAVVSINVYKQEDKSKEQVRLASGSGFIVSADGYIITNKHVIDTTEKNPLFRVTLSNGQRDYAQLVAKDPILDVAILRIYRNKLPFLQFADSDKLQVGQSVVAIGNALGLYQNSATKGIISGLARDLVVDDGSGSSETLNSVIQTDAEINHGNSGGPLIDLNGKVVGINTAIDESGRSIGFAVPINSAVLTLNSAIKYGRVIRPYLGVSYLMLDSEIAYEENLASDQGAWINSGEDKSSAIAKNSPAESAGLMDGDIILEVNNIKVENNNTLFALVQKFKPGDKITLKIKRGKDILEKVVALTEFKQNIK